MASCNIFWDSGIPLKPVAKRSDQEVRNEGIKQCKAKKDKKNLEDAKEQFEKMTQKIREKTYNDVLDKDKRRVSTLCFMQIYL
ncbi:6790_t:CDS:2 [Paraglomus brasilianum]|uniref:6790_t:CDS:1 n=1 Tax=Paraglomus brasilianum TaxID=144538 RepID=A0A9N8VHC2_9GLOM|nr:6790_t:CDS:2 [Paraglomus brasilianum]